MTTNGSAMLTISGLKVAYGGIQAVKGVDLEVREGELVTLIGANGAGKTTTMKAIMGIVLPSRGEILYDGRSLNGVSTAERVRRGIAPVLEARRLFPRMTARKMRPSPVL